MVHCMCFFLINSNEICNNILFCFYSNNLSQAWKSCLYGTYDSEVIEPDRDTVSVACLAAPGTPDGCDGSGSDDDGAPQPDRNDVIEERVMTRTHALPPPPRRTSREERAQRRSARRDAEGV